MAADRYAKRDFNFGLPAVILTTIVGSSVFATLQTNVDLGFKIAAGTLALVAAALSAVQTFMKNASRSEAHEHTSRLYGVLVREMQELQALPPASDAELRKRIGAIRAGFDEAAKQAFNVPPKTWAATGPGKKPPRAARARLALGQRLRSLMPRRPPPA